MLATAKTLMHAYIYTFSNGISIEDEFFFQNLLSSPVTIYQSILEPRATGWIGNMNRHAFMHTQAGGPCLTVLL